MTSSSGLSQDVSSVSLYSQTSMILDSQEARRLPDDEEGRLYEHISPTITTKLKAYEDFITNLISQLPSERQARALLEFNVLKGTNSKYAISFIILSLRDLVKF